jgi:hypothetical protein
MLFCHAFAAFTAYMNVREGLPECAVSAQLLLVQCCLAENSAEHHAHSAESKSRVNQHMYVVLNRCQCQLMAQLAVAVAALTGATGTVSGLRMASTAALSKALAAAAATAAAVHQ